MNVYYDSLKLGTIKNKYLVLDTNVLSSCSSDVEYYKVFFEIFKANPILIDPIVKLEFLRGAYKEQTYKEKNKFLTIEKFFPMADHQDIYKRMYDNAFNIARIYSHHGRSDVPLGDILITARFGIYKDDRLFLTEDMNDFLTLLFDRISIITFEKIRNKDKSEYLEHTQLLRFNHKKYEDCLKNLPE
ncbi:MAG: hypothetical protein HYT83_01890 [Candidatus Levybacteria bacterium]|nr:hypothetical protein [Candidatus Levybacteria bacterium]